LDEAVRVETGEATLIARREARVEVSITCGASECDEATEARLRPIARRLERVLDQRADEIWIAVSGGSHLSLAESADDGLRARQAFSFAMLALALAGLFAAPRARPPGSRAMHFGALVLVAAFFVAALTVSPPRPLHDHLCDLDRI